MPNAHLSDDPEIVLLAGADRARLLARIDRLGERLAAGLDVSDELDQPPGVERLAVVANRSNLAARLALARQRLADHRGSRLVIRQLGLFFATGAAPGRVAFLFPGQGSQHTGMLRGLSRRLCSVRSWFAALDWAYAAVGEPAPSRLIDPAGDGPVQEGPLFDMEQGAQLGTVADLALYELLTRLGVGADFMVGHSNGEHAAVIAAGAVTASSRDELCEGFRRVGLSGRPTGMPARDEGLVAVANLGRDDLHALLANRPGEVFLAMDNCPHQQVVGGQRSAVGALAEKARVLGALCALVPLRRAHHTPLFSDWAIVLDSYYRTLRFTPRHTEIYSCASAGPFPDDPDASRQLMVRQWTNTVQFRSTIEALYDRGARTFVEVGPDAKLTAFVEDTLRGRPHLAASVSSRHRDDVEQLFHLLAMLFTQGVTIDPAKIRRVLADADDTQPNVEVTTIVTTATPVSPSDEELALVATRSETDSSAAVSDTVSGSVAIQEQRRLIADTHSSLKRIAARVRQRTGVMPSERGLVEVEGPWPWQNHAVPVSVGRVSAVRRFTCSSDPFVMDHALGRPGGGQGDGYPLPVLPFTVGLRIAEEMGRRLGGCPVAEITDVRASRFLALAGGTIDLSVEAERRASRVLVRLAERGSATAFLATAHLAGAPPAPVVEPEEDLQAVPPSGWTAETFYRDFAFHGPSFQGVSQVTGVGPLSINAELVVTSLPGMALGSSWLDPALLDCAGQLVAFWLLEHEGFGPRRFGVFPYAAGRVLLRGRPPGPKTRIHCRGQVILRGSLTESSFVFQELDGRVVATIEGLLQRIISFPPALASRIVGDGSVEFSEPLEVTPSRVVRGIRVAEWEILAANWGIWGQAVAHRMLEARELAAWLALPTTDGTRTRRLLERIVADEAIRCWGNVRRPDAPRRPRVELRGEKGAILAVVIGDDCRGPEQTEEAELARWDASERVPVS
jgi:malonyl CoA-acyl carrier protein transacylase